jgi:hypothetical protein
MTPSIRIQQETAIARFSDLCRKSSLVSAEKICLYFSYVFGPRQTDATAL